MKKKLAPGAEPDVDAAAAHVDKDTAMRDYALNALGPTRRAFAERTLAWIREVVEVFKEGRATGN